MEQESDVMPPTSPINELGRYIKDKGIDAMTEIPMGRRSGKKSKGQKVILAYLQEKPERRVYFVTYDYKTGTANVPDDFDAIRDVECSQDESKYLPMDGPENSKSFKELLNIDKTARGRNKQEKQQCTIICKPRSGSKKNNSMIKTIDTLKNILFESVMDSKLSEEKNEEMIHILDSEYLRAWGDAIKDYLAEYDRSSDIDLLVNEIKKTGKLIGLKDKPETVTIPKDDKDAILTLVGAMFITGEKFDSELPKKD